MRRQRGRDCSALVEGHLPWREMPLVQGMRLTTIADGWESVDAIELAGYSETQQCKLGGQFTSLLVQEPTRLVCPTPSHGSMKLVVNATLRSCRRDDNSDVRCPSVGSAGFFYPLYLVPPNERYHTHYFEEHPTVAFYQPDAHPNHARPGIDSDMLPTLLPYSRGLTRSGLAREVFRLGSTARPTLPMTANGQGTAFAIGRHSVKPSPTAPIAATARRASLSSLLSSH